MRLRMTQRAVLTGLTTLLIMAPALVRPGGASAAGPWRATVVDAETGQPMEGVVVVAAFIKYTKSFAGTAGGEYYGSDEVVTGADGRFEIPSRVLWNPIRMFTEVRFELIIFKAGYDHHRLRIGSQDERRKKLALAEILQEENVILELVPLKKPDDRRAFLREFSWPSWIPRAQMRRLIEAVNREREFLGLEKIR